MKNNKGYTLVELLISLALLSIIMLEIFGVMQNSSKLFSNGTYEVELQTEAQQVIQQLNELMIDCNNTVSANFNSLTNSDDIIISFNEAKYTIVLSKDNPSVSYGNLYYTKEDLTGGGDSTPGPILMAEYVNSISLNCLDYKNNFVTLSVSMNNGKYSYVANQAIYFRNDIGSGSQTNYKSSGSCDYDLDILRLRQYDLDDYVSGKDGETFTYAWDSADSGAASPVYDLDSDGLLETKPTTNVTATAVGPYTIIATGSDGTIKRIKVSSKAIDFGNGGAGICFANIDTGGGSFKLTSAIPIQGIAIEEASSFTVEMVYYTKPGASSQTTGNIYSDSGSPSNQQVQCWYPPDYSSYYSLMKISSLYFGSNKDANTFEITHSLFTSEGKGYGYYVESNNAPICFSVKIEFSGADDLTGNIYVYPYKWSEGSTYWSTNAESAFWTAVGW